MFHSTRAVTATNPESAKLYERQFYFISPGLWQRQAVTATGCNSDKLYERQSAAARTCNFDAGFVIGIDIPDDIENMTCYIVG